MFHGPLALQSAMLGFMGTDEHCCTPDLHHDLHETALIGAAKLAVASRCRSASLKLFQPCLHALNSCRLAKVQTGVVDLCAVPSSYLWTVEHCNCVIMPLRIERPTCFRHKTDPCHMNSTHRDQLTRLAIRLLTVDG